MATATATKPTVVPTPEATPEPVKRVSHYRPQTLAFRWHESITDRPDLVAMVTQWAEKQGHLVVIKDLKRSDNVTGQSIRIGGSVREGAQLMTKETRDLIKAAGFTPDQLAEIVAAAAAKAQAS